MDLSDGNTRLKALIEDTILLLCKNGVGFENEFTVEALVVITVDDKHTFHSSVNERIVKQSKVEELEYSPTRKRHADDTEAKERELKIKGNLAATGNVKPQSGRPKVNKTATSPISKQEPDTLRIATRSARKLAEQASRKSTRSTAKIIPHLEKPSTASKKAKTEPKSLTRSQKSPLNKSVGEKTGKEIENGVEEEPVKPETIEQKVEDVSIIVEENNANAVLEIKPQKDRAQFESVSIDTRGSILIPPPKMIYGPEQPVRRQKWERPVKAPIILSSPTYISVNPHMAPKLKTSGKMSPHLAPNRPVAIEKVDADNANVIDLDSEAEIHGQQQEAGNVCASELSPTALNNVMEKVIHRLSDSHRLKSQGGDNASAIKVTVGLPPRTSVPMPRSCFMCKTEFESHEEAQTHDCSAMAARTGVLYGCEQCSAMFMKQENLMKHRADHASTGDTITIDT